MKSQSIPWWIFVAVAVGFTVPSIVVGHILLSNGGSDVGADYLQDVATAEKIEKPTAKPFVPSAAKSSLGKRAKVEQTVYVTRTGSKYHRSSCRYLRSSKIPTSLSEAKDRYSPCSVCSPPHASADAFLGSRDTSFTSQRSQRQMTNHVTSGYRSPGQVAENGSYYGEISRNTGRPKTTRVRGYYRKDGTYVRGHYRSR